MTEAKLRLCDGRSAVKQALEGIQVEFPFTLRSGFPRLAIEGDSVVWGEYSNTSTEHPVVDEVSYQVSIRSADPDHVRKLSGAVNAALLGLGLKREYSSPDGFDDPYYTKTFRFGRRVDKRTMRLID